MGLVYRAGRAYCDVLHVVPDRASGFTTPARLQRPLETFQTSCSVLRLLVLVSLSLAAPRRSVSQKKMKMLLLKAHHTERLKIQETLGHQSVCNSALASSARNGRKLLPAVSVNSATSHSRSRRSYGDSCVFSDSRPAADPDGPQAQNLVAQVNFPCQILQVINTINAGICVSFVCPSVEDVVVTLKYLMSFMDSSFARTSNSNPFLDLHIGKSGGREG